MMIYKGVKSFIKKNLVILVQSFHFQIFKGLFRCIKLAIIFNNKLITPTFMIKLQNLSLIISIKIYNNNINNNLKLKIDCLTLQKVCPKLNLHLNLLQILLILLSSHMSIYILKVQL